MNKWTWVFLVTVLLGFLAYVSLRPEATNHTSRKGENAKGGATYDALSEKTPPAEVQATAAIGVSRFEAEERGGKVSTQSIFKRRSSALKAINDGQPERGLSELLSCLNDSFTEGVHQGIRHVILTDLVKLGQTYDPAKAAVTDYRDAARELMSAAPKKLDYAVTFGTINKLFGEEASNIEVMDALPSGDLRRKILAVNAFDTLIERQRYADASEAKGLANMLKEFEGSSTYSADKSTETYRLNVIAEAAKNIQALAGSNKLDEAQVLINRVLEHDRSDRAKKMIKDHLLKSGSSLDLFTNL